MFFMNEKQIASFKNLYYIFSKNGFSLYFVGGTVRDYLLNKELKDLDVVTDATPDEMKTFLKDANYRFEAFGSVILKFEGLKFDVTTLRKEEDYKDSRHPGRVVFCKSINEDVIRRDFTINGLYMNHEMKIIDLVDGQLDLNNKIIKMIGEPEKRIQEDPLRIIRAIRFMVELNFSLDEKLLVAIKNNRNLIDKLNKDKVDMEISKSSKKEEMIYNLKYLNIL